MGATAVIAGVAKSQAASALISALSSSKAEKTTKNLAASMKSMEETEKSGGFDKMKDMFGSIAGASSSPVMLPFQLLMTQFQSQTIGSQIELMNALFKLLENPAVQATITEIAKIVSWFIELAAGMAEATDAVLRFIASFKWVQDAFIAVAEAAEKFREQMDYWFSGGPIGGFFNQPSPDDPGFAAWLAERLKEAQESLIPTLGF